MARRLISTFALTTLLILPVIAGFDSARATRHAPVPHALQTITLGMGYVPSVQFAPFYLADQRGYYRQAGLQVDFAYGGSPNQLELVGTGHVTFAIADGTDVLVAAAQGVPVTYVTTQYQRLPAAIFALSSRGIRSVADLRGKTVGLPFRFGALYAGLLAALHTAGLRPDKDVMIKTVGFNQAVTVQGGKVDAAVDYSNNGPVILARRGLRITVLQIGDVTDLVGPGVIAGRPLIARNPELVRAFVQATLRGMADAVRDPQSAFTIARQAKGLPPLRGSNVGDQYAVLQRTIPFWHDRATHAHGLGYADPAQWRDSARILQEIGQLPHMPAIDDALVTNRFAAGSPKL